MVPMVGVEPTRPRGQRILNPPRLPIPTHRPVPITIAFLGNKCIVSSHFPAVNVFWNGKYFAFCPERSYNKSAVEPILEGATHGGKTIDKTSGERRYGRL